MKKVTLLWLLAFIITISTAVYQRLTGPTYPITGIIQLADQEIKYKLARSHGGEDDYKIKINANDPNIYGSVHYKRFKTNDQWTEIPFERDKGELVTYLPHQPPAGKLEYFVELNYQSEIQKFPKENSVVIRFKGDVPPLILIPHIIAMFMSMLLSNRTGLEFFNNGKNLKKLTYWTIGTLLVGGFIFGPLTQEYAFGELWTGFPFGHDLTDNKTLIALIGWLIALYMYERSKLPKKWALFASVLLLVVYLIPHSVLGSELNYNEIDQKKNETENVKNE